MKKMHYLHRGWQNSSSGGPISLGGKTHFQRRLVLFPSIFYLRSLRIDWFQSFSEEFNYSKYTRKRNISRADKKREMWDFITFLPLLMIPNSKFLFYISICRYLCVSDICICKHNSEWEAFHEDWKSGHHFTLMNYRPDTILKDIETKLWKDLQIWSLCKFTQKLENPIDKIWWVLYFSLTAYKVHTLVPNPSIKPSREVSFSY